MSANSKIEWTDSTWNPIIGCTKISPGCAHCYAETFAERFRGVPGHPFEHGFDLQLVPKHLNDPLKWREPRRVFVNSMSDLFHEGVPFDFIDQVFAVMALTPRHTYQILTKRPERLAKYFGEVETNREVKFGPYAGMCLPDIGRVYGRVWQLAAQNNASYCLPGWPLPNVWLGVSCEDQQRADERIPILLQTPAAKRFISCEPLLGPVDLTNIRLRNDPLDTDSNPAVLNAFTACVHHPLTVRFAPPTKGEPDGVNWVIVGGESGPKARPMEADWVRSIQLQCQMADVPFFFKQWGGVRKKEAGRLLDGREWNEMPKAMQREERGES